MSDFDFNELYTEHIFPKIKTYADFAKQLDDMILCNQMGERLGNQLEQISGTDIYDEENDSYEEIFQWYIISDPSFAIDCTDELIFYDNELDLHVLGVTHCGTGWSGVPAPDLHVPKNEDNN